MIIKEASLKHWIEHFYGYGSWDSKFWFVGYEEGGGELPEEVAEKFEYFDKAHCDAKGAELCNIRELYKHVTLPQDHAKAGMFNNLYEYRFGNKAAPNNIWKNLIAFKFGYRSEALPDLLGYQKNLLASTSACDEALIQLYPLPSPHNHAWYYSWLQLSELDFIRNRVQYQQRVYPDRIRNILDNIFSYNPEVVLMHSMDSINMLKQSVQETFADVKFGMTKAIKHQIPQHHYAKIKHTTLIITTQIPTLRHNRIESGFDWYELGKMVKGYSII